MDQKTFEPYPLEGEVPCVPKRMRTDSIYPFKRCKPGEAFTVPAQCESLVRSTASILRVHGGYDFRVRRIDGDLVEVVNCQEVTDE